MSRRRRSSTAVRRDCYEYWLGKNHSTHEGVEDPALKGLLQCYLCLTPMRPDKDEWEAEHVIPHGLGGSDYPPNVKPCNAHKCPVTEDKPEVGHRLKTKGDVKVIAKTKRVDAKSKKFKRTKNPIPGSRASGWQRKYNKELGRWETIKRR